jgi:hypothetical protein
MSIRCMLALLAFVFAGVMQAGSSQASAPAPQPPMGGREAISEALGWMRSVPKDAAQFDYVMTARVRLLVFWAGKDDVGGGYIRRGISRENPREELIQILFGSDPAKAPRNINRWGAGTEVEWHRTEVGPIGNMRNASDTVSSAFFGFMKSSSGKSASEMQAELKKEKEQGQHAFKGILSRVERGQALSLVVPLNSDTDYNLHQYDEAEPLMLEKIGASDREVKKLDGGEGCEASEEFLGAVEGLMNQALGGGKAPLRTCYVYDSLANTLTLEDVSPVKTLDVVVHGPKSTTLFQTKYDNLVELSFLSEGKTTGKKTNFSLIVGTEGQLRGVPVQIRYQPNWWFQVVLNLKPNSAHP